MQDEISTYMLYTMAREEYILYIVHFNNINDLSDVRKNIKHSMLKR